MSLTLSHPMQIRRMHARSVRTDAREATGVKFCTLTCDVLTKSRVLLQHFRDSAANARLYNCRQRFGSGRSGYGGMFSLKAHGVSARLHTRPPPTPHSPTGGVWDRKPVLGRVPRDQSRGQTPRARAPEMLPRPAPLRFERARSAHLTEGYIASLEVVQYILALYFPLLGGPGPPC